MFVRNFRDRWVNCGAPSGSLVSSGAAGLIRVRHGVFLFILGRLVHQGSMGSLGCAWGSSGSSGVIGVRSGDR